MSGTTAQKAVARAIARHPHKDGRHWCLRTLSAPTGGSSIAQGHATETRTNIDPVVQTITEHEAGYIGENIVAGDLRLILNGLTPFTESSVITCDGETVDVLRVVPVYQDGILQEQKIYVRRRPEDVAGT
jgi:hypothetical protein